MNESWRRGPVPDREYARRAKAADDEYVTAMDVVVTAHYPSADGEGVRALSVTEWGLVASLAGLPKDRKRAPTVTEVARLADMADYRRSQDNVDPFACFGQVGA